MEMEQNKSNVVKITGIVIIGIIMVVAILQQAILPSDDIAEFTGTGKVSLKPDTAVINLSIATLNAKTPEEALSQNNEKMKKIETALSELGIPESDRIANAYAFNPQYDDSGSDEGDGDSSSSKGKSLDIVGYDGFQQVEVTIRGIDNNKQLIDKVIEKTTKGGVSRIGLVNFSVANIEKAKDEARAKAIENAKAKVEKMKDATGIKLGKVIDIYESIESGEQDKKSLYSYSDGYDFSFPGYNPITNVGADTEVSMDITLTYEVK